MEHQGSLESQVSLAQQEEMEEKEMLVLGVRKENLENQERMNWYNQTGNSVHGKELMKKIMD